MLPIGAKAAGAKAAVVGLLERGGKMRVLFPDNLKAKRSASRVDERSIQPREKRVSFYYYDPPQGCTR